MLAPTKFPQSWGYDRARHVYAMGTLCLLAMFQSIVHLLTEGIIEKGSYNLE